MSRVAVITDSTAYLPQELIQKYAITVIPLAVVWEEEVLRDGVDISPQEFYDRLPRATSMPTTSQLTVEQVKEAFESLLERGHEILAMFISSKFSGSYQSALQARAEIPGASEKIAVVDSLFTTMAMGWPVLTAARAAQAGESLASVQRIAEHARDHSGVIFVVETLEFLRRGGRIGGAQALLGTMLNIKPLLEIRAGQIEPVEKVRTKAKAIERMLDLVEERVRGQNPLRLAASHAAAEAEALTMLEAACERMQPVEKLCVPLSPVIGTHAGPGTVALNYMAGVE
ncbi:MAG: DegV family protein [Anaerolineales bacterium]